MARASWVALWQWPAMAGGVSAVGGSGARQRSCLNQNGGAGSIWAGTGFEGSLREEKEREGKEGETDQRSAYWRLTATRQ